MTPFQHQAQAFERFKDQPFGALFLEQGLGKTKIAIDLANYRFNKGDITGALVITPKSLVENWALVEIPLHSPGPDNIVKWSSTSKKSYIFSKQFAFCWFIANIDAVITDKFVAAFRAFYATHTRFMLIVDESTTCKTPNSQRTRRMLQISDYSKYKFILSGTPITNSPLDIWAQAQILNPGLLGGKNFFMFKQHYAKQERVIMGMRSFMKVIGYQNLDELTRKINKFAVIAKKEDCLDLPPKIYRRVPCPLTAEQQHHYDNFKREALTRIETQEFTAVNAVSLLNYFLQICAGQIRDPDGTYHQIETDRVRLLSDLMSESPEKALIWCSFVGAADAIETGLPLLEAGNVVLRIKAETPPAERQDILEFYTKTERKPGLLLNQASLGKGLTILEGRNTIYYSQRFSVEQREQSEDRPHRIGQTRAVLISELYAPGTAEEKVIKVLREGRELANKVITDRSTLREFIS